MLKLEIKKWGRLADKISKTNVEIGLKRLSSFINYKHRTYFVNKQQSTTAAKRVSSKNGFWD